MQYLHHHFYSNFTASVENGESEMTKDLFISELSDFIVYDTPRLVQAMTMAGLDVKITDSDEELIDTIAGSLGNNAKLAKTLAFIFAESNQLINNGKTGKEESEKIIKELQSGILIVGKDIRSEEGTKEFKADVLEHIYSKSKTKGDYKRTILISDKSFNKKSGFYVLGYLALLGIGIYVIYRIQRKSEIASLVATASAPITPLPADNLGTGGVVPPVGTGAPEIVAPVVAPTITPVGTTAPVTPITPTITPSPIINTPVNG